MQPPEIRLSGLLNPKFYATLGSTISFLSDFTIEFPDGTIIQIDVVQINDGIPVTGPGGGDAFECEIDGNTIRCQVDGG
ncbi:MAG: hypothetical protein HND55_11950 [Pseudomonadota bacterium]|nr:MAG: hypothetical protein HND55_11950 [Pseudomonadota bacterium]